MPSLLLALAAKSRELAAQAAAGGFTFEKLYAPWWREMFRGLLEKN